ncbi:MAG: [FeFe] hydrogenase H-cluster maturation GTPase HydF [Clostridia bacterium]|nr:[FeFe] hydrogenase H-cluster maturation GTPase HydF [Clostridia bacterium]
MSLNSTPSGERTHIGFFGRRNAGKSSLLNAFTNQEISIVSDYKGTTTDPVSKSMELLPLGPVTIIDTPGIDDEGDLGMLRVQKCIEVMRRIHIAIVVIDVTMGVTDEDIELINNLKARELPLIIALNKCDLCSAEVDIAELAKNISNSVSIDSSRIIAVSANDKTGINELKELTASVGSTMTGERSLLPDYIKAKDIVVLVTPIDSSAPKGRMILPQQQVLRAVLDINAKAIVVQVDELAEMVELLGDKIALVITDSQAFGKVNAIINDTLPLTSFSILMAKYKGDYDWQLIGANALDEIAAGDKVLIAEGCTHHRQCEDIGTVKLPNWITKKCGEGVEFDFLSGGEFKSPEELKEYKLVIQCGGCMLNENELKYRVNCCKEAGVPITNYGMAIAKLHGILDVVIKY